MLILLDRLGVASVPGEKEYQGVYLLPWRWISPTWTWWRRWLVDEGVVAAELSVGTAQTLIVGCVGRASGSSSQHRTKCHRPQLSLLRRRQRPTNQMRLGGPYQDTGQRARRAVGLVEISLTTSSSQHHTYNSTSIKSNRRE
jgi:hypothetical protein